MNRPADVSRSILVLATGINQKRTIFGNFEVRAIAGRIMRNGTMRAKRHDSFKGRPLREILYLATTIDLSSQGKLCEVIAGDELKDK